MALDAVAMVDGVPVEVNASSVTTREDRIVNKMTDRRKKKDLQFVIGSVMNLPVGEGEMADLDSNPSLSSLSKANTTVMTRIILNMAYSAVKGDLKAAELLFKYGGMTPVEEKRIEMALPTFVDDMSSTSGPAEPKGFPMERLKKEEDNAEL